MRRVAAQHKIIEAEVENIFDGAIERHGRQGATVAGQLLAGLIEVIRVKMCIAQRVYEITQLEPSHLRDHHCQQRIRRDIERDAEKNICAALI